MGDKTNRKDKESTSTPPRVTYHAGDRTFDRLFKEGSLNETRDVVRRKLGLSPATIVELAQLREGKKIDLEDDDDYDAFRALARSNSHAEVVVTIRNAIDVPQSRPAEDDQPESSRKRAHSPSPLPVPSTTKPLPSKSKKKSQLPEPSVSLETPVHEKKKRKVMFDASADAGFSRSSEKDRKPSEIEKTKKKKEKEKAARSSSSTQPVASSSADVVVPPKKKKERKDAPKEAEPVAGPSRLPDPSLSKAGFPQPSDSSNVLPSAPEKGDKKRKRTASETVVTDEDAVEARPKKKKKAKKAESATTPVPSTSMTEATVDKASTSISDPPRPESTSVRIPGQTVLTTQTGKSSLRAQVSLPSSSATPSSTLRSLQESTPADAGKARVKERKKVQGSSNPLPAEPCSGERIVGAASRANPPAEKARKKKVSKDESSEAPSEDVDHADTIEPPLTKSKEKTKAVVPSDPPMAVEALDAEAIEPYPSSQKPSQLRASKSKKNALVITDDLVQAAFERIVLKKAPGSEPVLETSVTKHSASQPSIAKRGAQAGSQGSSSTARPKLAKKDQGTAKKGSQKSKLSMAWLPEDLETNDDGPTTSKEARTSTQSKQDKSKVDKRPKKPSPTEAPSAKAAKPVPAKVYCPACFESPYHPLEECYIVLEGEESIETCIKEMEADPSLADSDVLEQLRAFLPKGKGKGKGSLSVDKLPARPVDRRTSQSSTSSLGPNSSAVDSVPNSLASTPVSASKLRIPAGLPISEVHVETQDEGSSNESSDEESDEQPSKPSGLSGRKRVTQRINSSPVLKASTLEDELAALMRGPECRGQRKSILDEIPLQSDSDTEDADSEPEDLVLDEEEDFSRQPSRRRSQQFAREKSSSEEPVQGLESADRSLSPPVFMDAQPNAPMEKSWSPEIGVPYDEQSEDGTPKEDDDLPEEDIPSEPGSLQALAKPVSETPAGGSESPEPEPVPQMDRIPQPNDAMNEDVSPELASPDRKDVRPEPQDSVQQEEEEEEASPEPTEIPKSAPVDEDYRVVHSATRHASPEPESDATAINTDAAKSPSVSPPPPEKPASVEIPPLTQVLVPSSPSPPPVPDFPPVSPTIEPLKLPKSNGKAVKPSELPTEEAVDEQVDEIESVHSAADERDPPSDSDPIESASQPAYDSAASPLKSGTVKRLRDRNGKSRTAGKELPVLASSQVTEQVSDEEDDKTPSTQTRRSGRLATRQMTGEPDATSAPAPKKRGRKPLTEKEKAAKAAAAQEEKTEKAQIRAEKTQAAKERREAAAAAKKQSKAPASRSRLRATKASPVESNPEAQDTPAPAPADAHEPSSSPAKWPVLTQSTPALPSESSAVDELRSSPEEERVPAKAVTGLPPSPDIENTPKGNKRNLDMNQPSRDTQHMDEPPLHTGRRQFPRTQTAESQRTPAPNGVVSDSEDEGPQAIAAKPRPQRQSSASYRRLTELASQDTLFSPSGLTPSTPFPPPSSQVKTAASGEGEDEDEDSSDSDSDDSDAPPKSHIPKTRRAGAAIKKKLAGLLSFA